MSHCTDWEERAALAAGGDLPPAEAADVERHLAHCPGCRKFAADLRASLDLLREAHAEPIAPAAFTAVRARVMERLERRRRRVWLYAAAAVLLLAVALYFAPRRPPAPVVVAVVPPAPVPIPLVAAPAPASRRPRPVRHPKPHPARPLVTEAGPEMVRLMTDDPNVVIYWLLEKKGE
jgi:anti-sigma factor RsiW